MLTKFTESHIPSNELLTEVYPRKTKALDIITTLNIESSRYMQTSTKVYAKTD